MYGDLIPNMQRLRFIVLQMQMTLSGSLNPERSCNELYLLYQNNYIN